MREANARRLEALIESGLTPEISAVDYGDRIEITIKNADGMEQTVVVNDGEKGEAGNGIVSIQKVSTVGLVDTYQITFDNGDTSSFTVTNGRNGDGEGGGGGSCIYVLGEDESLDTVPDEFPVVIDPDGEADDDGGAGVSSWNDLTDKPFGEVESEILTYDGRLSKPYTTFYETETDGVLVSAHYVKVSGSVPKVEDLDGKEITIVTTDMGKDTVTKKIFPAGDDSFEDDGLVFINDIEIVVVPYDAYIIEKESWGKFIFPSKGVYVTCITLTMPGQPMVSTSYVKSFAVPGYVFKQTVPIEEKYIPDSIQRVGDGLIINSSTEGSTKKFKITVDDSGTISAVEVIG